MSVNFSGLWPRRNASTMDDKAMASALLDTENTVSIGTRQRLVEQLIKERKSERRSRRILSTAVLLLGLGFGGKAFLQDPLGFAHGGDSFPETGTVTQTESEPEEEKKEEKKDSWHRVTQDYEPDSLDRSNLAARPRLQRELQEQMGGTIGQVFRHTENLAKYVRPAVVKVSYYDAETQNGSTGSGYVHYARGIIVTNAHVVDEQNEVTITLLNGEKATGRVLGKNDDRDVAVIQVDPNDFGLSQLPALQLSRHDTESVEGEWVMAVGHPYGSIWSATLGIISSNDRSTEGGTELLQTDAPINKGNSGGPLVNMAGEVVGLNSATVIKADGISYSVSADEIRRTVVRVMLEADTTEEPAG